MKLYNKPWITLCLLLTLGYNRAGAQNAMETLRASYTACIKAGRNKTDCAKRWYQQTDSLAEQVYLQLWNGCDSAQRDNMADERDEWMERRNAYFEVTFNKFKRNSPDDPSEMFAANIGFVNKRIAELQRSEPRHYSPEFFQIGINGKYALTNNPDKPGDDGLKRTLTVRQEKDGTVFFKLFMRSDYGGGSKVILSDVLQLQHNTGVYSYEAAGGMCSIRISFKRRGAYIQLLPAAPGVNCVFGENMPIDGFYVRISEKRPGYSAL